MLYSGWGAKSARVIRAGRSLFLDELEACMDQFDVNMIDPVKNKVFCSKMSFV
jgi:hypothetical protein